MLPTIVNEMPFWFLFIYRWFCFLSQWLWISLYLLCCKILYDIFFARPSRIYGSFQLEFLLHVFLLCVLADFLDSTFWFILRTWNGRSYFMCLRGYSFLNFWEYQLEFLKILLFFELSVFPKESIWLSCLHVTHVDLLYLPGAFLFENQVGSSRRWVQRPLSSGGFFSDWTGCMGVLGTRAGLAASLSM